MNLEKAPGGYQLKKEALTLAKIFNLLLNSGDSQAKDNFLTGMSYFTEQVRANPVITELIMDIVQEYRYNLNPDEKVEIYNSLEKLFITEKINFNQLKIGTYPIDQTKALKEHLFDASHESTLRYFVKDLNDMSNPNYNKIIDSLLKSINSDNDIALKNILEIDLLFGKKDSEVIKSALTNLQLENINQNTITNFFYNTSIGDDYLSDLSAIQFLAEASKNNFFSIYNSNNNYNKAVRAFVEELEIEAFNGVVNRSIFAASLYVFIIYLYSFLSFIDIRNIFYFANDIAADMYASNLPQEELYNRVINVLKSDSYNDPMSLIIEIYKSFYKGIGMVTGGQRDLTNLLSNFIYDFSTADPSVIKESFHSLVNSNYDNYYDLAHSLTSLSSLVTWRPFLNPGLDKRAFLELELDMYGSGLPVSLITNNLKFVEADMERLINFDLQQFNQTISMDLFPKFGNDLYAAFNMGYSYPNFTSALENSLNLSSQIIDDFVSSVQALYNNEEISNNYILSTSIAALLTPYSSELASQLEDDMNIAGLKIEDIKYYLQNTNGLVPSQVSTSMYVAWGGAFISSMEGARALVSDLYQNSITAEQLQEYFTVNSVIYPYFGETMNFALAKMVDKLINGENTDQKLINNLYLDFDASGFSSSSILNIFATVSGVDAAEITANIYRNLQFPYDSAVKGKRDLAAALYDYYNSDYVVTLNSFSGYSDISPSYKYLNLCSFTDGVYTVGGSVFSNFDMLVQGKSLYGMQELYSDSGRLSARSQCAAYLVNNIGQELYLTTTKPAGVIGDQVLTGCSDALDPATFTSYCESVFSVHIPV